MEETSRLALPLIAAGQAQKEDMHNEALALMDLVAAACVEAVGPDAPPADPGPGRCWIVGANPTGAWAGRAGALAGWTPGGWRFVDAIAGMTAWSVADAMEWRFDGAGWRRGVLAGERVTVGGEQVVGARRPAIADPAGGETVDGQAREAIAQVLAALRAHGLIAG